MSNRGDISNISVATIVSGVGVVLGLLFLFVLSSWITHVNTSLAENGADSDTLEKRVTIVETNIGHILSGINRIEAGGKSTSKKVDDLRDGQTKLRERVNRIPTNTWTGRGSP